MSKHWAEVMILVVLALGCKSPAAPAAGSTAGPAESAPQAAAAPAQTVELGMSASQVEALLGKPSAVQTAEADPGTQVWVYDVGKVVLSDGQVVLTDPAPFPRP